MLGSVSELIAKVAEEKQKDIPDQEFADKYLGGISRQLWGALKAGTRNPQAELLGMILVSFPEYYVLVNKALTEIGAKKLEAGAK